MLGGGADETHGLTRGSFSGAPIGRHHPIICGRFQAQMMSRVTCKRTLASESGGEAVRGLGSYRGNLGHYDEERGVKEIMHNKKSSFLIKCVMFLL